MTIKVSTLLSHNTVLALDSAPSLGGPLDTSNYPIVNGGGPVTITGNEYPITTGAAGQVLTTNGLGILYWANVSGTGTVTSVGVSSIGANSGALTIGSSPVTGAGVITITPNVFTSGTAGIVPASGGGTSNYLRADGTWSTPPGGGGGGSGTVTSVGINSSTLQVTGTNPVTSSGTIDIEIPNTPVFPAAYGSASAVGSFTVNSQGRLTSAASIPISILPAQAGLSNVANSLQVINAGGTPSIQEGSGVPSIAASVGALYVDQAITNGNSLYYYSGAAWIPLTQFLKLYAENVSTYTTPAAAGTNSIALGDGAQTASGATDSLAIGNQSLARTQGGVVQASGRFTTSGDAQTGRYLLRSTTINSFATELFINGTAGGARLVLPDDSTWTFKITITAHRTDVQDGHAGYVSEGVIYRASGAATTNLQGRPNKTVLSESNPSWDINISADSINGSLKITVTGETGKTIRWLALVETVEVTN